MVLNKLIGIASICLILSACGGDSDNKTDVASAQQISIVMNDLSSTVSSSNIVMGVNNSDESAPLILTTEDNQTVNINRNVLKSFNDDQENWQLSLTFVDDQTLNLPRQGTTLPITEANITLNPNGTTPLSAIAQFNTPISGKIRIKVMGKSPAGISIEKEFSAVSTQFSIPILGLYADYDNQVEFTLLSESGKARASTQINIQTPSLTAISNSAGISSGPNVQILQNQLSDTDDYVYLMSSGRHAFDQNGEVRWVYTGPMSQLLRKMDDGTLIGFGNENSMIYHHDSVKTISMLGEETMRLPIDNLVHHDVQQLPNGNFLVPGNTNLPFVEDGLPEEDVIFEIDPNTHQIIRRFDMNPVLDPTRIHPTGRNDDWLHMNALYFDENNSSIVFSAQAQSAIVSIAYPSGELQWIIAEHKNWPDRLKPFLLAPLDNQGKLVDDSQVDFWPYGQHAPVLLPNGNIFVYDNGQYRGWYQDNSVGPNSYSRGVEYKVNPAKMTIELVWEYSRNQDLFTPITGDADYIPSLNHRLIGYMAGTPGFDIPRIIELDENNDVVFDAIVDRGIIGYRVEKFDLYEGID